MSMDAGTARPAGRETAVDVLKGLLTVLMVTAHVLQFMGTRRGEVGYLIDHFANLCCFPGFMFAFGYGSYFAYFRGERSAPTRRMASTALKVLLAYYLSGLWYLLCAARGSLSASDVTGLFLFTHIPIYCEFLLAFSLMTLLAAVLRPSLTALLDRPLWFGVVFTGLLSLPLLLTPTQLHSYPALLVGATNWTTFPVLQFSPLYLAGLFFARHRLQVTAATACVAGIGALGCLLLIGVAGPSRRFPPSFPCVMSSLATTYFWFGVALWSTRTGYGVALLARIGQAVLFHLLVSNLVIFAVHRVFPDRALSTGECLLASAFLLAAIQYLAGLAPPQTRPTTAVPCPAGAAQS